ncbi:MAG: hypothetical protein M3256_11095, partial [Actinomycetota bacterium]|nr:hypothetical protein [Actinomycetota bacterium]
FRPAPDLDGALAAGRPLGPRAVAARPRSDLTVSLLAYTDRGVTRSISGYTPSGCRGKPWN